MTDLEASAFKAKMTEAANAHLAVMQGMGERAAFRYVKKILADNDVVIGVWLDPAEPDGAGTHVIKGKRALDAMIASGQAESLRRSAVPCSSGEQAVAAEQTIGDGAQKLN